MEGNQSYVANLGAANATDLEKGQQKLLGSKMRSIGNFQGAVNKYLRLGNLNHLIEKVIAFYVLEGCVALDFP